MVLDKVNWQLSRSSYYTLFTFIVWHIHCFQFLPRSRPKEDNSFIQFFMDSMCIMGNVKMVYDKTPLC